MNSRTIFLVLAVCLAALAGIAGGYWFAGKDTQSDHGQQASTAASTKQKEPLFYRSPMNPEVTSPVPAKDAMGMDYVAVYADDGANSDPPGTVSIDPVTVQNIGVRTALAERRSISRAIQTVGRVDYDEKRIVELHPKTDGWVEKLLIDTTGAAVEKNTVLLSFYSPQLVSTQQEYVLALNNLKTLRASKFEDVRRGAEELVTTTLERLQFLDVPEHQIKNLHENLEVKKELHIHSPAKGIVTNIGVRQGQYVTPQTKLYTIADLSKVWVFVDIYEDEMPWVNLGDKATITVAALPGHDFKGVLSYIYPYAESQTRTIKLRMEFDNPGLLLKPDMFANVAIEANERPDVIAVPSEAIVRSGLREQVFVQRAPGKFEPRDVVVGVSSGGWTEIQSGIERGEDVVVSAQFLIDSESKLREAVSKMREPDND